MCIANTARRPTGSAAAEAEEDAGGGGGGPSRRPPRRGVHRASPYGLGPRRWLLKAPVASRIFPTVSRDLYALWLLLAVPALDFTDALVILGVLSASHILAFLFTAWSVDFRAFVGHSKAASSSASGETEEIYFDFRKQRFFYSAEKDNFFKLRYPTKDLFGHYIKGTGYGTEAKINTAVDKWGRNM